MLPKNLKTKIHKTIISPSVEVAVKHGFCLREENLRVFEERELGGGGVLQKMWVLRGVFTPKKEKVAGGCKPVLNEETHNLYSSPCVTWENK
jgi:hypothetical protein